MVTNSEMVYYFSWHYIILLKKVNYFDVAYLDVLLSVLKSKKLVLIEYPIKM